YGIYRADSATISVTSSNVWNNSSANYSGASAGAGTISVNPLYVSATDLRLTSNSPSRFGASGSADQGALAYDGVPTPGLYGTLWTNTTLTAAQGPYTAAGDLIVPGNVTLTVEPGVTISFQASSDIMQGGSSTTRGELIVRGQLVADGTPAAPITFGSTSTTSGSWYGIDFDASSHDSVLDNIVINRAIYNLTYRSTGTGNAISRVTSNAAQSYGLYLRTGGLTLDGFTAIGAGSVGIYVGDSATPTFTNCVVRNNGGYGIYVAHTSASRTLAVSSCTLNANGTYNIYTGAGAGNGATFSITNSIITNGSYGVYRADSAIISVTYSDVWNNSSANYSGASAGTGTISVNPQFVSATDLHLQGTSVAIDSGTAGPTSDAEGFTRPLEGNGIGMAQWDMGAYEFVLMPQCGNGALEPGETCDHGANNGTYGYCNAACTGLGPRCGDGAVNGPEQCDDMNASNTDACLSTCRSATCGDGYVRAGVEQCDDTNTSNTDDCLNTCVAATCGDGYVRAGVEQCDDMNTSNTDACLGTCVAARCGDGFVQAGVEQCDDSNTVPTDACTATCTTARCGDGVVQGGVEACDDGNVSNTDSCTTACMSSTCGDGVVQADVEECDDGNTADTDACRYNCIDAACGDGVVRPEVEECDDGNAMAGDGCSPACLVEGEPPPDEEPGGGCCQSSQRGSRGSLLLAGVVALCLRRRRRAAQG
ncbi:MAG TPA: DUF4215 domain-containing protein, partial [Kofleriaceae bacterium]|nr:DUF4215 domain-containing protein [Kofleriaceae bacterium]